MLKNLKLRLKIGLGFSLVLILTVAVGIIGYYGLQQVLKSNRALQVANDLVSDIQSARQSELTYALTKDQKNAEEVRETVGRIISEVNAGQVNANSTANSENMKKAGELGKQYISLFNRVVELDQMKKRSSEIMAQSAETTRAIIEELKMEQSVELNMLRDNTRQARDESKWKASTADRIMQLVMEAENAGLTYFVNNEMGFKGKMSDSLNEADGICSELLMRTVDEGEMDMVSQVQEAIGVFGTALNNYDRYRQEQRYLEMAMAWNKLTNSSAQIMSLLKELQDNQGAKYQAAQAALIAMEVDGARKAAKAGELLNKISEANAQSMVFQLTGDEMSFANLGEILYFISSSAEEIKKELTSDASRSKADEVAAKAQEYLNQVIEFKTFRDEQENISRELARNAVKGQKEFGAIKKTQLDEMKENPGIFQIYYSIGRRYSGSARTCNNNYHLQGPYHPHKKSGQPGRGYP